MRRSAFTLMEVMLVVLLMGIAAAAVTLRTRSPIHLAGLDDAIGQIAAADALARQYALGQGRPVHLVVTLADASIARTDPSGKEKLGRTLQLGSPFEIVAVLTADQRVVSASAEIGISSQGFGPSYAINLKSGPREDRWLVFLGTSGQMVQCNDEQEARDILRGSSQRL